MSSTGWAFLYYELDGWKRSDDVHLQAEVKISMLTKATNY